MRSLSPVFVILGVMLWLTTLGAVSHPAYRLVLMVMILAWAGYIVRTPKSN